MGNTFEQYVGLKSSAASRFSDEKFSKTRKAENRSFLQNEQYAGLESQLRWDWSVQAVRSRGSRWPGGHLDPGVPRGPGMPKSRKLAFPVGFCHSGRNGPEGRLGPPEFTEKPGKAGKAGKHRKQGFLRVQGPLVKGAKRVSSRGNRRLSGSVPGKPGTGHLGSSGILHRQDPCNRSGLQAGPLSTGEASPPQTPPNRQRAVGPLPPLVVLGAGRPAALVELQFPDARPPGAREGGTGSFALPRLQDLAPLGGSPGRWPGL